jgi:NADH-quinone oxidoreductase subunit J
MVFAFFKDVAIADLITFFVAALICIFGAVGVIGCRNPVHSALSLVATLFGVAVMFVSQQAHFLGAVQVIVYAGAIVVLFLFVIMLLGVDQKNEYQVDWETNSSIVAMAIVLVVGGLLLGLVGREWKAPVGLTAQPVCMTAKAYEEAFFTPRSGAPSVCPSDPSLVANPRFNSVEKTGIDNVSAVSRDFLTAHLFAFQATAVLLIIAVIGTVVLAKRVSRTDDDVESDRDEYRAMLARDTFRESFDDPLSDVKP